MKVTISRSDLISQIDNHDIENCEHFVDLADSGWFTKSSTQWRDVPELALPIPCWNPQGSSRESEAILEFIDRSSSRKGRPIIKDYHDEEGIGTYELLEHLDAGKVPGLSKCVPSWNWIQAWEDDKADQIEVMADDWLTWFKANDWDSIFEDSNPDFDYSKFAGLEVEVTVTEKELVNTHTSEGWVFEENATS